jgi:glucose/arabinose dehydrogenase
VHHTWPGPRLAHWLVLAPALLLMAYACSGETGGDLQEPPALVAITVTGSDTTLTVGQTVQLTATAEDANGAPVEGVIFGWSSSDPAVASVSETGLVTGLADGQTEIRATAEGVTGSLLVTVAATAPPPPPPGPVSLALQPVASGLGLPLYLTSPPNDPRLFIVEKGGAIRIMKGGTLLPAPFLDISGEVSSLREQGLLGLAFPPDYAASGRFYIHYTDTNGDTRVSALRVSADPDRADPASETTVLTVDQPGPSHNGGQLSFGPDGYLYLGLGDGGSHDGLDQGRGQSLADLLGSILRIDVSAGQPYAVPPDNPYAGSPDARPEIWSSGLRNPWRFSFDRQTGDLYIADVGEKRWEEVNLAAAAEGRGRGANYGWSRMEGDQCFEDRPCDRAGLTVPFLEYRHPDGCAIIGGYVYRGGAIPGLQGHYFYGDLCQEWVRSFRAGGATPADQTDWPALRPGGNITSFGEDAAGELYILTTDGRVLKIVAG